MMEGLDPAGNSPPQPIGLMKRKPLPNPEPFNGKRADYLIWQGKIKMKLYLD